MNYVRKQHRRLYRFHEVINEFEQPGAHYGCNSFGVALTIGFIEQLLVLYNTPRLLRIKTRVASTGSMDASGKIHSVSEKIITEKMQTVFYSDISTFIVPEADLAAAQRKLQALQAEYPQRRLDIDVVRDLADLLDRRSLIEIKKQNTMRRLIRTSARHPGALVLSLMVLLLAAVSATFIFKEIDANPAIIENSANMLIIKNKAGKILRSKPYPQLDLDEIIRRRSFRLVDIDSDGPNEVLLCNEPESSKDAYDWGRLACFNNKGQLIWKYVFRDSVRSKSEIFENIFRIWMIDTTTIDHKK